MTTRTAAVARPNKISFIDGNGSIDRRGHCLYYPRITILTPRYVLAGQRGIFHWETANAADKYFSESEESLK